MNVKCSVEEIELEGECASIPSVCATCRRCGHQTESYGTHEKSIDRCLVLMNRECPKGEDNFYVAG